ncbi:hypothetical protein CSUI_010644 [Cystoisospora suis]|uniref:Uncharacterized protein n=1 Tax=Cystoisospora suis TaxID=483139 RepID=A0A2C6KGN0_9APIC|nr:hypothetical protein CSUI_010644 [Cystoisospora suis]
MWPRGPVSQSVYDGNAEVRTTQRVSSLREIAADLRDNVWAGGSDDAEDRNGGLVHIWQCILDRGGVWRRRVFREAVKRPRGRVGCSGGDLGRCGKDVQGCWVGRVKISDLRCSGAPAGLPGHRRSKQRTEGRRLVSAYCCGREVSTTLLLLNCVPALPAIGRLRFLYTSALLGRRISGLSSGRLALRPNPLVSLCVSLPCAAQSVRLPHEHGP